MKTGLSLAIYLAGVVLASALVAPWVFAACQWFGPFRDAMFHDVLNRVLMLLAVGGAFVLIASQKALSRETLGLTEPRRAPKEAMVGACVAIGSVAAVWFLGAATGALVWDGGRSAGKWLAMTALHLLIGVVVGVIEEIFFRGCLLGWLRQRWNVWAALGFVTLFYAITHFLDPPKGGKQIDVDWLSGFVMLGRYCENLGQDLRWLPQFAMLLLVGLTLGWCFLRTSRLYLPMGLHAGWVFAGKMLTFATNPNAVGDDWWFGSGKIIGSPITIVTLAAVFALMIWMCRQPMLQRAPRNS